VKELAQFAGGRERGFIVDDRRRRIQDDPPVDDRVVQRDSRVGAGVNPGDREVVSEASRCASATPVSTVLFPVPA
jgi:hypothetical protein